MKWRAGVILCLLAGRIFAATPSIIPLPLQMQLSNGVFTLCPTQPTPGFGAHATTKILVDAGFKEEGQYLAGMLLKSTGYEFVVETNASSPGGIPGAIVLTTATTTNVWNEGYELTVQPDSVVIRALSSAGIFYGIQSLLQLAPPQIFSQKPVGGVAWTIPCVYIFDKPRFVWRGFMMDSVRHFFTKDEVRQTLDALALHKVNYFHWHLDDDSGWRLEIKNWPLLTQTSAWRTDLMWDLNTNSSSAWRADGLYGGYYTQQDVREIVEYARQRHITVVPEIEMPGHSTSVMAAYPQFSCNGGTGACPSCLNGPYSLNVTAYSGGVFCVARPETTAFIQSVLSEVMSLFPGPYIHIGGDEVVFSNWQRHSLDQALTNSLGLTNTTGGASAMQKYQSYFTQQMNNWIRSQGRTMVGWSEIFNGGLVTNGAVVMDWKDTSAVQAATNQQYVVMASSATLYINKWENGGSSGNGVVWSNDAPAQSGFCPLTNVYNYEPIPVGLSAAYTNYILGAEGPCWAEWIPSLYNLQFKAFPRLAALAEVNWTQPALKNFNDFSNRLILHKQRLDWMGVNYNRSATPPTLATWVQTQISTNYQTLEWDITSSITNSGGEIPLTFCWKTGANGLDVAWAALIENGVEINRDTHAGFTGASPSKPLYVLRLPFKKPATTYLLRASVAGRGGTNSNGTIYFPNWD
jgi:hexosaminidase